MPRPLAYDPKHALNAICPYYTMFPLEYPFRILKNHRHELPIILDPFCGRGTTIYAAREMGFPCWGIDSSPIAVAIAKAKLASAELNDILQLANELVAVEPKEVPQNKFFKKAFHKKTFVELCSLREGLLNLENETEASILLRAAALGCLHGPLSKTKEGAAYFSNQMPRTFAAKPDYAVKFWKERGLEAPNVRIIDILERKLKRITNLNKQINGTPNQILHSDSRSSDPFQAIPEDFSVVITSPPYYYGMRTYIQDQWLRMWFLGGPDTIDYKVKDQLDHNGHDAFVKSLSEVWKNVYQSKSDNLDLYIRFGALPSIKSDAKNILKSSLEEATGWRVVYTKDALTADNGKRQANQMGKDSKAVVEYDFHVVRR